MSNKHAIRIPSEDIQSSLKGGSVQQLAERRRDIITEQGNLQTEKRFLEEQVVERLLHEGRTDMLNVNWSRLERIG